MGIWGRLGGGGGSIFWGREVTGIARDEDGEQYEDYEVESGS